METTTTTLKGQETENNMTPKVTAQIAVSQKDAPELYAKLEAMCLHPRWIKQRESITFTPPKLRFNPGAISIYDITRLPEKTQLILSVQEAGGQRTQTKGSAIVICSAAGKPLRPVYVPEKKDANGIHAFFVSKKAMIMVRAEFNGQAFGLQITEYAITVEEPIAWLNPQPIFASENAVSWFCPHCGASSHKHGEHKSPKGVACEGEPIFAIALPASLKQFDNAVKAAVYKASCLNCKHTHFANMSEEVLGE